MINTTATFSNFFCKYLNDFELHSLVATKSGRYWNFASSKAKFALVTLNFE
ncbi:hypothetical protein J6W34_04500 [bacterium]|nr:hypothetical protein [bacterium]MBO7043779.1 hypothetical protein [bacterium]